MNDVELMLSHTVQNYYGREFFTFQKLLVERNENLSKDRSVIADFILGSNVSGNILDIGCGSCQWFQYLGHGIDCYFALDTNANALAMAPRSEKIFPIIQNIFSDDCNLSKLIRESINHVILSFFLSHFSDATIRKLMGKLKNVNSLLIIDSLWNKQHEKKYLSKDLRTITRRVSEHSHISLPKRFFELSDVFALGNEFGYSVEDAREGQYWFICKLTK